MNSRTQKPAKLPSAMLRMDTAADYTRGCCKTAESPTVAALYERRFFLESTKYRRSQTAATVDCVMINEFCNARCNSRGILKSLLSTPLSIRPGSASIGRHRRD